MTTDPIQHAQALAQSGQLHEAVALLDREGTAGNAAALAELAIWFLAQRWIQRDIPKARALMAAAAALGHCDAAIMHIAMVANGSGGAADWPEAVTLLRRAAQNDPVAAAQLALIGAMQLRADGSPGRSAVIEPISAQPYVARVRGFLSKAECAHISAVGADLLEPSTVIDSASGRRMPHPIRTSDGGAIGPLREDLVVRAINHRIAAASDTATNQGEPLTVLRYQPGQQYRLHHDTIQGARNQRIRTVLLYLNDGFSGGETVFPRLNVTIVPRAGDALIFDNLTASGSPEPLTVHAGLPVTSGAKWLATRWVRRDVIDPWNMPRDAA